MQLAYYCLEALPSVPLRVLVYCHCLLDLIGLEYVNAIFIGKHYLAHMQTFHTCLRKLPSNTVNSFMQTRGNRQPD